VPLVKLIGGGSRDGELKAIALNDYSASLPLDDAGRFGVILATRMSGKPMAVKDKGPSGSSINWTGSPSSTTSVFMRAWSGRSA